MANLSAEQRAFVEAGMGICMAVIMADGKFTQDELAWWKTVQARHPLFKDVSPEEFNPLLAYVKEKLAGGPWQASVDGWAKAVPEAYRVPMIELASELATVDKGVEGKEPEVIRHLTAALGVPAEKGREIFMQRIEHM
jgi:uncharacterized tellurite resistance protein B-like protein